LEARKISSTSKNTASCDDIILDSTSTTRLIFRPTLINNPNDSSASIRGEFFYQRKGLKEQWEDVKEHHLSKMKKGEGVHIELRSGEILKLFTELKELYQIHKIEGVPRGETRFVKATPILEQLIELNEKQLGALISGKSNIGLDLISRLIQWAVKVNSLPEVIERLESASSDALHKLNFAVGLSTLKKTVDRCNAMLSNPREEDWQAFFSSNSFFLEQLFAFPVVLIKGKVYVGGKSILNQGGNIADFLVRNALTRNVALIEIKTPLTRLLGKPYRTAIYNVSEDLTGAVLQVLNYKESLSREFDNLTSDFSGEVEACDPPCFVIIGNATAELNDKTKRKSFELFRRQVVGVQILTYDEVIGRTERLINFMELQIP
jgi:hypothetical protein